MGFDGLKFQFFYQRFKVQCIQLLFTAFLYVVINKVDQVPDKEKKEIKKRIIQYYQPQGKPKAVILFSQ